MKKSELIFTTILLPLDFLALLAAGLSAYALRFQTFVTDLIPVIFNLPQEKFLLIMVAVVPLWLVIFAINGLYSFQRRRITADLRKIFISCSVATLIIVVAFFFNTQLFSSRFIILVAWVFSIVFVGADRLLIHFIKKIFYKKGRGVAGIVIIGEGEIEEKIRNEFVQNPSFGFRLIGQYNQWSEETRAQINQLVSARRIDEIIYLSAGNAAELMEVQDYCINHYLSFKYVAPLPVTLLGKLEFDFLAGWPLVNLKKTPLDGWGRIGKRLFDIIISIILLIIFSPILLLTAIIIKLDSKGPIFYLDYRSGQNNKRFLFYKFRSMIAELCDGEGPSATVKGNEMLRQLEQDAGLNTRANSPLHKIKDDPRVTKVGKFIRRWSIDELPQLFNVLKGDLSLVGPRAHMTLETAKYEADQKRVLTIKPGITGLAQISGRSDLLWQDELKLDLYYIENWSLGLDLQILLKTPLAVLRRRKAE